MSRRESHITSFNPADMNMLRGGHSFREGDATLMLGANEFQSQQCRGMSICFTQPNV